MTSPPLVLEGISLLEFIQYILKTHAAPSTLVVCSSKDIFLQQLHDCMRASNQGVNEDSSNQQLWATSTLRLLATSRTVEMVFCPEVAHLRAYLTTYALQTEPEPSEAISVETSHLTRTLAILNPIDLHRPTSAFSAQGLNRSLSIAVEAAHQTHSRLILAECASDVQRMPVESLELDAEDAEAAATLDASSPWDEEASILNVTTKSFGAGERGWVGRTVKVRTIAERWCIFQDMNTAQGA